MSWIVGWRLVGMNPTDKPLFKHGKCQINGILAHHFKKTKNNDPHEKNWDYTLCLIIPRVFCTSSGENTGS
jgi:hypothetical protein